MVFSQNLLLSCWPCLNGHRSGKCEHEDRPLYALKNKGRPSSTDRPRSEQRPDIVSLHSAEFLLFHQSIMEDSKLKKMYFHEKKAPAADKNVSKRSAPYQKRREKSASKSIDIYGGTLNEVQLQRWRVLCGLTVETCATSASTIPTAVSLPAATNPSILAASPRPTPDVSPSTFPLTTSDSETSQVLTPQILEPAFDPSLYTILDSKAEDWLSSPLRAVYSEDTGEEFFYSGILFDHDIPLQDDSYDLSFLETPPSISTQNLPPDSSIPSSWKAGSPQPAVEFKSGISLEPLLGQSWTSQPL
jgi:hypothetical protein